MPSKSTLQNTAWSPLNTNPMTQKPPSNAESNESPKEKLSREELRRQIDTPEATESGEGKNPEKKKQPENREAQQGVDQRMAELQMEIGLKGDTKSAHPLEKTKEIQEQAEKKFVEKLIEKGGGWAVLGSAALAILSFFGFKKAKALRESIKTKGYLRTAVETAKEHPIFTAFIAALGIKAGFDAYEFVQDNAKPITEAIATKAKEMGVPGTEAAKTLADKVRTIIGTGVDTGLKATVKGISSVLGGTYDEETGVVNLGGSTLHMPVVTAFEAGFRRRAGNTLLKSSYSRLLIEDRLSGVLRQIKTGSLNAASEQIEKQSYKKLLAERGVELLHKQTMTPDDIAEVERIVGALEPDLKLEGKAIREVQASPIESEAHLTKLAQDIEVASVREVEEFKAIKSDIETKLLKAEEDILSGKYRGSAQEYKSSVISEVNDRIKKHTDTLTAKKIVLAKAYTDAANGIDEHVRYDLDATTHGSGRTGGVLEKTTKTIERAGINVHKLPGGKLAVGAITGYSLLPLALEGMAALRPGEAGDRAKKAFVVDATEAGIGFIPVVGELNDFRAAIMGTDLNGRELDTWSRVTCGTMGALGTAAIGLGFFTGGTTIIGFKAIRTMVASRRAIKAAKLADKGIETAKVTDKTIDALKAVKKGSGAAEQAMEKMHTVTNLQQKARTAKNYVHNAQRTMQIVTYSQLGCSLVSGVTELYNSAEGVIGTATEKVLKGIDTAEQFATDSLGA